MGKWFENHAATMDRMLAYWLLVGEEGRAQLLAEAQAAQHAPGCDAGSGACAHGEHGRHAEHGQHATAIAAEASTR
jgi:hypothetical protein